MPNEEPSIIFPVGAVIEDNLGIFQILKGPEKQKMAHVYKTKVLQMKQQIPDHAKMCYDSQNFTLIILAQNVQKIKRLA